LKYKYKVGDLVEFKINNEKNTLPIIELAIYDGPAYYVQWGNISVIVREDEIIHVLTDDETTFWILTR